MDVEEPKAYCDKHFMKILGAFFVNRYFPSQRLVLKQFQNNILVYIFRVKSLQLESHILSEIFHERAYINKYYKPLFGVNEPP